jgi:hypothetical protein
MTNMDPVKEIGRWLLMAGGIFIIVGAMFYFGSQVLPLGKLPGDIRIEGKNYTVFFPIVSSIVISIILTILLNLFLTRK